MDGAIHETGLPDERQGHLSLRDRKSTSSSSANEKERKSADIEMVFVDQPEDEGEELTGASRTINTDDPFPIDPDAPVEERQFTLRAVLVGCGLGAIISASNIYLGLKVRFLVVFIPRPDVVNTQLDGLDLWCIAFWFDLWLRHSQTALDLCPELSRRRLLWPKRKQRGPIRRKRCRLARTPLYLRFPRRIPTRTPQCHP